VGPDVELSAGFFPAPSRRRPRWPPATRLLDGPPQCPTADAQDLMGGQNSAVVLAPAR